MVNVRVMTSMAGFSSYIVIADNVSVENEQYITVPSFEM